MPDSVANDVTPARVGQACRAERRRLKVTQGHGGNRDDVMGRRRRKANVRERSRMRCINDAFERLRALLPPPRTGETFDRRRARHDRCRPSKVSLTVQRQYLTSYKCKCNADNDRLTTRRKEELKKLQNKTIKQKRFVCKVKRRHVRPTKQKTKVLSVCA